MADIEPIYLQLKVLVNEAINQDLRVDPLIFDTLVAEDFVTWLVTLKRNDGGVLSLSALNKHGAGLSNLFWDHGKTMSKTRSLPPISKPAKHVSNGASVIKTDKVR
ncbi:hypothetical protein L915_04258 [Phytophthora nicotianae]|uniref:Uncharacterized protein n=1 Tax=Phytophthora nicotianae TaxID=4792 RepID=W2HCZ4_PHYNI|nr:hypothetical protein L915_04258 [Phytophthora nicotianae]